MIKTWTLQHFKSVYEKTTLEMAPLTIFAGANSSGKSTLIQSLLLTAQTLQSPVESRPIILNGHIVRLGAFDDVVSNEQESNEISIGFELQPNPEEQAGPVPSLSRPYYSRLPSRSIRRAVTSIDCSFAFSARGAEEDREILQLQPRLEHCSVKVNTRIEGRLNEEVYFRRSSKTIEERLSQLQLSDQHLQESEVASLEYEVVRPLSIRRVRRLYGLPATGKPAGVSPLHFLPGKVTIIYDAVEEQSRQLVDSLINPDELRYREIEINPEYSTLLSQNLKGIILGMLKDVASSIENKGVASNLKISEYAQKRLHNLISSLNEEFSLVNVRRIYDLPASLRRLVVHRFAENANELYRAVRLDRPPENTLAHVPLVEFSDFAVSYTQRFFSQLVKYLGPLRDEPKPVYPLAGATDPKDIGFRGEHTAAVLEVHRNTQINYIPSEKVSMHYGSPSSETTSLASAVLDWLDYMGVASDVVTVDKGKLGHELKIATTENDSLHDLTHVGVGVSQVLPILVLSLLAEQGATLIFEQPELHLHPKVQTRLADFFVSMTMLGKQCIVETHSEYLINRLRYQVAVSEGEEISKEIIMYFVEKQDGHSAYRAVRINKYGVIEDWPKGFFDENEKNAAAILKAGMTKRKRESDKQHA